MFYKREAYFRVRNKFLNIMFYLTVDDMSCEKECPSLENGKGYYKDNHYID